MMVETPSAISTVEMSSATVIIPPHSMHSVDMTITLTRFCIIGISVYSHNSSTFAMRFNKTSVAQFWFVHIMDQSILFSHFLVLILLQACMFFFFLIKAIFSSRVLRFLYLNFPLTPWLKFDSHRQCISCNVPYGHIFYKFLILHS